MATLEKIKKKKGKQIAPAAGQPPAQPTPQGSLISVQEAGEEDKTDTVQAFTPEDIEDVPQTGSLQPEDGTTGRSSSPRPGSRPVSPGQGSPRPGSAASATRGHFRKNVVEPVDNQGSMVSIKSKEAWNEDGEKPKESRRGSAMSSALRRPLSAHSKHSAVTPLEKDEAGPASPLRRPPSAMSNISNKPQIPVVTPFSQNAATRGPESATRRPPSAVSRHSVVSNTSALSLKPQDTTSGSSKTVLGPAEMNESHAYVPYTYAKDCISRIVEDMKRMKSNHIRIVDDIQLTYGVIEDETQAQFNIFVVSLRDQYSQKVTTFRQVIEVHRIELQQKQQYWDEALASMGGRNRKLLLDKKMLLIQNKVEFDRLEKEKKEAVERLTKQLDESNASLTQEKSEHEVSIAALQVKEQETKVLNDQLETEKSEKAKIDEENERLREEIEELRRRPVGVAAVAVAEDVETQNAAPVDYEPTVVVTDLSEEERRRMTEERERMAEERESMREDRKRMEEERLNFVAERRKFHEEKVMLQGEVTNITKEREIWKVKFESLKSQLGELAELRAKYEALQAQMSAIAFLAVAHTEEDKIRIKEKISKAEQDKEIMTEEKLQMERDIKKFMDEFQKENGREPNEDEKPDSLRELEVSLAEADSMIRNLDVQIETLEKLKSGVVPEAPVVAVVPIDYKEPEVKTVEVTVPDPVVVSQLDKTQTELEELKKELSDSKKDNTSLREQISHLEAEVADVRAEVTAQEATIEALKEQLEEARRSLALGVGVAAGQSDADVEKLLREKEKEFEKELKEKEKERKQLEKDLKKLLKAQAKQQKTDDNERVKKLLEATVREVVGIHSEVGRASELVNERLKAVEGEKDGGIEKQQAAQQEYDNWVIGWAEENGKEPTPKERDGDAEGKKLFAVVEASGKASEDTELSIEALNMIKTGHVPDKLQPAPVVAAASVALTASAAGSGKDTSELEDKIAELEDEISELKSDNKDLENNNNDLEEKIEELERQLEEAKASIGLGVSAAVTADTSGDDLEELNAQLSVLQKQVDAAEGALAEEKSAHDMTQEELEALQRQLQEMNTELQNTQAEAQAKLEGATTQKQQEIDALNKKIDEMQARVDELEKARLDNVPVDTAKEILALKASITAGEVARDSLQKEKFASDAKVKELDVKIKSLENSTKSQKTASNDSEKKMKALKAEKDKEIKSIQNQNEKKEKERQKQEEKKIAALEKKIQQLQIAAAAGAGAGAGAASAKGGKADAKGGAGDAKLQEKLRETKAEATELKAKVKQLELELKTVAKSAGSSDKEVEKQNKKNEKILKELEKKLDSVTKKNEKNESNLKKKEEELKDTQKELKDTEDEVTKLKAELAALGIAAKEGVEAANKVKSLESEVKKLTDENKTLSENFQSERVLRKKYYNMVEDMKGKIRVYCRVRPMSGSEKDRGNYSVAKSPDEYTITLDSTRGVKEFQFDQVFMPESSQERVFEDTNNLIQSAVDGYNVCIFAYGQTGSGKTFTIIGDSSQKFPGIAPRAFDRIFTLLDENKSKFGYTVSCYMLELYNDKLLDLFSKTGAEQEDKLDIKKDKKGMVVVQGAEVKKAKTAKDLMALFEEGSVNRHTASTKMNAESSRSHLVIGIIIETTNKVSGQIMKGKLSLVDLAGSERAAKTGAGAEQLKEAMSINKSLSALGDVISALSSEQSFIPYRNNKLTMLMQDSLGGNAKTLMFVNISPADYNTDESVVSLTYASRVKLITNDASKNADNKEIARLKGIISKLKKGDAVEEEDEEVVE